jgi:hypothetical protein
MNGGVFWRASARWENIWAACGSFQIDRQVAVFYRNQNLPVPAVTDDATFMRRAFLVSIGRIPTSEESLAFLEIDDPQKREQLVGYLLNSRGYSSHMANWAFDLLRLTDGRTGQFVGQQRTLPALGAQGDGGQHAMG